MWFHGVEKRQVRGAHRALFILKADMKETKDISFVGTGVCDADNVSIRALPDKGTVIKGDAITHLEEFDPLFLIT